MTNIDGYITSFPIPKSRTRNPNEVYNELTQAISNVADDLAQEILDRTAADATKANKSTTINGKSLAEDRVIYAQDVPSKNLLPNTASTQTINGVTFTVNADGSVSCSGTASATAELTFAQATSVADIIGKEVIMSGCPAGGSTATYRIIWKAWNGTNWASDVGDGWTGIPTSTGGNFAIQINEGVNANGLTFYPMIRLASIEDDSYVPYAKTNVELSQGSAGSNYTRLPDGTQICWGRFRVPGGSASAWAGVYHIEYTLNEAFPVPFISNPSVTATCDNESSGVVDHLLWTSEKITGIGVVRQTATDYQKYFSYIAVGRWK